MKSTYVYSVLGKESNKSIHEFDLMSRIRGSCFEFTQPFLLDKNIQVQKHQSHENYFMVIPNGLKKFSHKFELSWILIDCLLNFVPMYWTQFCEQSFLFATSVLGGGGAQRFELPWYRWSYDKVLSHWRSFLWNYVFSLCGVAEIPNTKQNLLK